ncbi:MAG: hypothetical protein AAGJ28_24115 [Pseudomonadota bacterium]
MHTDDDDEETGRISAYYGVVPTIAGILFAGGLIWFMFAIADGFA